MNENENIMVEETTTTDPVCENEEKAGFGEYAILGLAATGAVSLGIGAVKLGKKLWVKGKAKLQEFKAKRAEKKETETDVSEPSKDDSATED